MLNSVYPQTTSWTQNSSQIYQFETLRDQLGILVRTFDRQDPLSYLVSEIYSPSDLNNDIPKFQFGGWQIPLLEGLPYFGADPKTRSSRAAMASDRYRAEETVLQSWQASMIMTTFIYSNFARFQYIPQEALESVQNQSHPVERKKFTGVQAVTVLLPFISDLSLRHELILRVLENSGNAKEFAEIAAIYLHEIDSQIKYHPEADQILSLPQAWGNVERTLAVRGDDLGIPSHADLMSMFFSLKENSKGLEFFKRKTGAPDPADWVHNTAIKERQKWVPNLSLDQQLEIIPKIEIESASNDLSQNLLAQLKSQIAQDPRQRLVLRVKAQKASEPLRSQITDLVRSRDLLNQIADSKTDLKAAKSCERLFE